MPSSYCPSGSRGVSIAIFHCSENHDKILQLSLGDLQLNHFSIPFLPHSRSLFSDLSHIAFVLVSRNAIIPPVMKPFHVLIPLPIKCFPYSVLLACLITNHLLVLDLSLSSQWSGDSVIFLHDVLSKNTLYSVTLFISVIT